MFKDTCPTWIYIKTYISYNLKVLIDVVMFVTGTGGSRNMANRDLPHVNKYKDNIDSVGRQTGMDAAVIAGIISRESRGGTGLDGNGWGDHGNAFGLMQVQCLNMCKIVLMCVGHTKNMYILCVYIVNSLFVQTYLANKGFCDSDSYQSM